MAAPEVVPAAARRAGEPRHAGLPRVRAAVGRRARDEHHDGLAAARRRARRRLRAEDAGQERRVQVRRDGRRRRADRDRAGRPGQVVARGRARQKHDVARAAARGERRGVAGARAVEAELDGGAGAVRARAVEAQREHVVGPRRERDEPPRLVARFEGRLEDRVADVEGPRVAAHGVAPRDEGELGGEAPRRPFLLRVPRRLRRPRRARGVAADDEAERRQAHERRHGPAVEPAALLVGLGDVAV